METSSDFGLTLIEDELTAISTDRGLILEHMEWSLEVVFLISLKEEYVSISKQALDNFTKMFNIIFMFIRTIKCKKRGTLQIRVCLSNICHNIREFGKSHQARVSHE